MYRLYTVFCIARLYTRALYSCIALQVRGTRSVSCIAVFWRECELYSCFLAVTQKPGMKYDVKT